jgi:ubiquinone/menaquinone biosynthesis C-methylase UbiE
MRGASARRRGAGRRPATVTIALKRWLATAGVTAFLWGAATALAAQDRADTAWLVEVLELRPGAVVADIGAGTGELAVSIAQRVSPGGRVFASELGDRSLERLRRAVESAPVGNVIVLEGDPDRTNLPEECCDAVFLRSVYHHFASPRAMNASLWGSLKPGGRLAVIDFAPRGSESVGPTGRAVGDRHGVTARTVEDELKQVGFVVLSSEQRRDGSIYVVARKPAP